ncbi:hypothetical protein LCGC14_1372940 [marine sediment metagenome]|uniref:Methyltransferase domain-containing protein n=1 Tax=marine sediment metagenome TaxID=412755 RepID=A0A0F9K4U2_9ZZZZ
MSDSWLNPNETDEMLSPIRANGLKLLDIKPHQIGVDYGCGRGALLIPAAKQCKLMIGIDNTKESIKFLTNRIEEEKITNCCLFVRNIKEVALDNAVDFSIVNGVLEWIPVKEKVDIRSYFRRRVPEFCVPEKNPLTLQLEFLKRVYSNLKQGGKLYLGIENRYDWRYFLWKKDPHTNLMWTSIFPRRFANLRCNLAYGRPYETYTYSPKALKRLLLRAGFASVSLYEALPSYHYPKRLRPLKNPLTGSIIALAIK